MSNNPKIQSSPTLFQLFLTFLQLGSTAFGGPAMVNFLRRKIVDQKKWLNPYVFDSGTALCQTIPGAIIMQVAAYCGLKIKGFRGALVSFIAFGFPSFLIMLILSILYKEFRSIPEVQSILSTLRVVIAAIVANAAYNFGKRNFKTYHDAIIAAVSASLFLTKLHPAIVVVIAALLGIALTHKENVLLTKTERDRTFKYFVVLLGAVAFSLILLFVTYPKMFILAVTMLRVDLFAFGGGLAAVPVMFHEFVDLFNWMDNKTFLDGIILGQITPGSIIVAATFIGYMHLGLAGSIFATIFVFTPSFLILMLLVPFFDRLRHYPQFNKVINGILCSFVGLLLVVTFHFSTNIIWNWENILIAVGTFVILLFNIDVIWVIFGGIIISFLFKF